jgi:hypothetical protein
MNETPTAADLIERAFGIARQSGRPDWWAMRSPVLKNRLLLLTKNTFKEADFGAVSFRDFLSKAADVVRVDETALPPFVILRSAAPEDAERQPVSLARGEQVRPDLWRAVLDYSSGHGYVWDTSQQVARPARSDDGGPLLPTISAADLDGWRTEFAGLHNPLDAEGAKRVEEWCKNRLPTGALPSPMRPVWNKYLKHKIEDRLQRWFASNSLRPPTITQERPEAGYPDEVERLRAFVIGCVKAMSKQELLDLRISPIAAMRTLQTWKGGGEGDH